VRNLERELATLCRKVARRLVGGNVGRAKITGKTVSDYLGKERYHHNKIDESDEVGAATGLVYTEAGGDTVTIEVSLVTGSDGRIQLTGQLGDVMKESAQTAISFVRSRAAVLGLDADFYKKLDVHVHVPAGAVPKDGPSAGITLATAIASALTNRPVIHGIAMTGEITLRGKVLPVGGVKEKVIAAHRAGIATIIMPKDNERDLEDIPATVRESIQFHFVTKMDEVLKLALKPA